MSESAEHKKLVGNIAEHAKSKGFKIECGDALGLGQCPETKGHIPDMKAYNYKEKVWLYGDAKTEDDIDNDHTKSQIKAFSGRTMKGSDKPVPFILAVPQGHKKKAEEMIAKMKLTDIQRQTIEVQEYKV